jgi:ATP-dependent Clp protease protease subunit
MTSLKHLRNRGKKKPAPQKQPSPQHDATPVLPPPQPTPGGGNEGYIAFLLDTLFNQGLDLEHRVITIEGEIETGYFSFVDAALSALELLDDSPITLRINTPGGSVYDGNAIIGRMELSPCDIITEGLGAVMSMGTAILAAGDKRRISKHAVFMYHCSSYGVADKHSQVKHFVKQAEKEEVRAAKFMAERSKKPWAWWKKLGSDTDAYLTPDELLEIGIVDEIF